MPYIGNPIYQSAFVTDQFSGDGTTTAFTMSVAPAGTTNVLVVVSGVLQDPSTYGVVGTTLNFSAAPPSGTGNISCRYLGVPVTGVTTTAYRTVTEFTATASQTTFTPPSYNVGFINVYLNGVLLGSADYTATNGTTVVLATGASAGNILTVESFRIESVANAISNSAGSVGTTNIADGAVTPAKLSTGGPYWDTSSNVGIGNSNPQAKVHVGSSTTAPGFGTTSEMVYNIGTNQPEFLVRQTGSSVVCSIAADSTGGYVRTATNHALRFLTNNTNQMNLTTGGLLQFNSGYGSVATAYGCRAWAKFNGITNAIIGSGNISSITDTGFSTYRANFTNNLVDANYAVATAAQPNGYAGAVLGSGGPNAAGDSNTNLYVALESRDLSNSGNEPNELFFAVFR